MKKGTYTASVINEGTVMFRVDGQPFTIRKGSDLDVFIKSERTKVVYPKSFMTLTFKGDGDLTKSSKKEVKETPKVEAKKVDTKKVEAKKTEAKTETKKPEVKKTETKKTEPKSESTPKEVVKKETKGKDSTEKKTPTRRGGRKPSVKIETEEK